MCAQWQSKPKRWRVRGKSPADGLTVTLGGYDTEEEARADCARLVEKGIYRDVTVEPIDPTGDAAHETSPS